MDGVDIVYVGSYYLGRTIYRQIIAYLASSIPPKQSVNGVGGLCGFVEFAPYTFSLQQRFY